MSTIKISDLATSAISLTDFIVKAGATGVATKNTVQGISDVINANNTLFKETIAIADIPSENGWYFASESGTYTNCGGLVIDTADNIAIIVISGTFDVFNKIDIPLNITIDAVPTNESVNAVQSGGVFEFVSDKISYDFAGSYTALNNFVRASSGTVEPNASYDSTDYIDCVEGDILETLLPNNGTAGIAFYNASNVYISGESRLNSIVKKVRIEAPLNSAKFKICKLKADDTYLKLYLKDSDFNEEFNRNEANRIADGKGENLSGIYTNTGSYVSALNGSIISNSAYNYSDLIDCEFGELLYLRLPDSDTAGIAFYNSSNTYVSGFTRKDYNNEKTLLNIPSGISKFRICKKVVDGDFILRQSEFSGLKSYADLNSLGMGAVSFDLNDALSKQDVVHIPSGTHIINTTITNLTGKTIYGVRGKTIIKASSSLVKLFDLQNVVDFSMIGVELVGTGSNIDFTDTTDISTIDNALNEVGIGTKIGVYIKNSARILIDNCKIRNFDAYGVYGELTGNGYDNGVVITNSFFNHNYTAIKSANAWEYSTFSSNQINNNQIGFVNGSGNNDIMGGSITKNVVGLIVNNLHANNSHGNCVGTKLNHNTVMCLLVDDINVGFNFNSIQCHETSTNNIYIRDSSGVVISNSTIKNGFTVEDGGGVLISSNCIRVTGQTITEIGTTYVKSLGNIYLDGSDNSGIND